MRRNRAPVSLGEGLRRVAKGLGGKGMEDQASVTTVWAEAVGENITKHAQVAGVRKGELLVHVDSSVWAAELSAMSGHLSERINEALGKTVVLSIRFNTSSEIERTQAESAEREEAASGYGDREVEPVPLTEEEKACIEDSFAAVSDEALRLAATRAALRDLEWKKGVRAVKTAHGGPGRS